MVLLDTCTLIWIVHDPSQISAPAVAAIRANVGHLFVSSISAYEIGVKAGRGKLQLPLPAPAWFQAALRLHGIAELPVTSVIAIEATQLPNLHNDPFDRMILATAHHHHMHVLTPDRHIASYPGAPVIW